MLLKTMLSSGSGSATFSTGFYANGSAVAAAATGVAFLELYARGVTPTSCGVSKAFGVGSIVLVRTGIGLYYYYEGTTLIGSPKLHWLAVVDI